MGASHYETQPPCEVGVDTDGWRNHWIGTALRTPEAAAQSVAYTPDGELINSYAGLVARYGDECVPESVSGQRVLRGRDAVHVLGGTAASPEYARFTGDEERFALTWRTLPITVGEILAVADLDGRLAIATPSAIVRDDGATFTSTPHGLDTFDPAATIHALLPSADGEPVLLATGRHESRHSQRMFLFEDGVATFLPYEMNATYVAVAEEDGDLAVVFAEGLDPGSWRPRELLLARRTEGVWDAAPTPLTQGAGPAVRLRDGVVHVASGIHAGLDTFVHYTRVTPTNTTQWVLTPRSGHPGLTSLVTLPPALDISGDGTVAVGYGYLLYVRHVGDASTLGTAPVTVHIRGSGRVYSSDGVLSCTSTCTVNAPVGTRMLVRAIDPSSGELTGVMTNGSDPEIGAPCGSQVDASPALGICEFEVGPLIPSNPSAGPQATTISVVFPS